MDTEMKWYGAIIGFVFVAFFIVVFACLASECKAREACESKGGTVERFNFRTVYHSQSCGENCTIFVPQEISDWRCVGEKAERE